MTLGYDTVPRYRLENVSNVVYNVLFISDGLYASGEQEASFFMW